MSNAWPLHLVLVQMRWDRSSGVHLTVVGMDWGTMVIERSWTLCALQVGLLGWTKAVTWGIAVTLCGVQVILPLTPWELPRLRVGA